MHVGGLATRMQQHLRNEKLQPFTLQDLSKGGQVSYKSVQENQICRKRETRMYGIPDLLIMEVLFENSVASLLLSKISAVSVTIICLMYFNIALM